MVDLKKRIKKMGKVRVFRGIPHQSRGKIVFFGKKIKRRGKSETNFIEHYDRFMSKVRSLNEVRVSNKGGLAGKL